MESNIEMKRNIAEGSLEKLASNRSNLMNEFCNNKEQTLEYITKGLAIGDKYFVSKIERNGAKNSKKIQELKEHLDNVVNNSADVSSKEEQNIVEAYKAFKMGRIGDYVKDLLINNTQDPQSLGGTAFSMYTLAKMLGEDYRQEVILGTKVKDKLYTIEDYITAKTNETFSFTPEMVYILRNKPNIFNSFEEVLRQKTNMPGSNMPLNIQNNYENDFEARKVKTFSISCTLQYNLAQEQMLNGYYGMDLLAMKQETAISYYEEFYYWNGIYNMFLNNRVFQSEHIDRTNAGIYPDTYLSKMTGICGTDGKLKYNFDDIAITNDASAKEKFVLGFRFFAENRYGNNTMKDPVLVLPLYTYDLWDTTFYVQYQNQNRMVGVNTFKEYFERVTGIKVLPLNLIDSRCGGQYGNFSLAHEDGQIAYFYDRSQFLYFTTREFKTLGTAGNAWGTANNVDFTQVYEGEFTDIFNPYYNNRMNVQNIPAVKFLLTENTALTRVREKEAEINFNLEKKVKAIKNK